jgi:hypothetical protein
MGYCHVDYTMSSLHPSAEGTRGFWEAPMRPPHIISFVVKGAIIFEGKKCTEKTVFLTLTGRGRKGWPRRGGRETDPPTVYSISSEPIDH